MTTRSDGDRREKAANAAAGRPRRRLRLVRRLVLAGLVLLGCGFIVFADNAGRFGREPPNRADAIVVLTGGSGRVDAGIELLRRSLGDRLLISGVNSAVAIPDLLGPAGAEVECCVDLGYAAGDTIGNAQEAAEWARQHGFHSLTVVTSGYHMARAMLEFRSALGSSVRLQPYAVESASVPLDEWWLWPGTMRLLASEYAKYLVALVRAGLQTV